MVIKRILPDEQSMLQFGDELAHAIKDQPSIIFLQGILGAGKTTLTRGFLRGLGFTGKVKSPTYTLVETYELLNITIFHFDFYRIHHPEELEFIGIKDYFKLPAICLIEWPEQCKEELPPADLTCYIEMQNTDRVLTLSAGSDRGMAILKQMA